MSRTEHMITRFQNTLGNSWWWRRFSDLVDRRNDDGTFRPFDGQSARRLVMTRRNHRKYSAQISEGVPIEHKLPYRNAPQGSLDAVVPMVERPEGMTRQTQRRLYREACKMAGTEPKRARVAPLPEFMRQMGYKKAPRRWRGMPEWQRKIEEDKLFQEFSSRVVRVVDTPR